MPARPTGWPPTAFDTQGLDGTVGAAYLFILCAYSNQMSPSTIKQERRKAILELLQAKNVHNHAELASLLDARGQAATQATLSRDLRDLGVVKGPAGYVLAPASGSVTQDAGARLLQAVRQYLSTVATAQNQVVLRTPPGGAQPLALALDAAGHHDLLGSLAGDDTILLISPDTAGAARLVQWLEDLR